MTSRSSGTSSRSRAGAIDVDVERPQVAVVEPDEAGPGRERPVELAVVVDLDERLEPELEGLRDEAGQAARRVEDREQQDEVRAGRAEQRQLELLDDEVLGQDRDADRRPDRAAGRRREPPNQCGSHRTEIAGAPPAS